MTAEEGDAVERQITGCVLRLLHTALRAGAHHRARFRCRGGEGICRTAGGGAAWPALAARQPLGEAVLVRRTWDGAIAVRVAQPQLDRVGDRAEQHLLRRTDGRWLIDDIDRRGA